MIYFIITMCGAYSCSIQHTNNKFSLFDFKNCISIYKVEKGWKYKNIEVCYNL